MGITIGAIGTAIAGTGVVAAPGIGIAGVEISIAAVATTITVAAYIGTSYLLNQAALPSQASAAGTQQLNVRQPCPPRRRYYGAVGRGGFIAVIQ